MVKIAFIGAGGIGFTRGLFSDIMCVPELQDTEFAFTDIDKRRLDMVTQLCRRQIEGNKLPARITSTTNRRRALEGADYVFNVVKVGGMEGAELDIKIPLKYGIDQSIGDTLCMGGIMYGQRNIPCILDFCKDMREVSSDKVLFLNYANPNAMNTWAAIKHGKVRTLGLCHGVEHNHRQIAEVLGAKSADEVDIICAGINHQTWYIRILYKGREISGQELLEAYERHPVYGKGEKVRIDMLRRFGYYTTETSSHVSEYVPWYRKRPVGMRKWIDMSSWLYGASGVVLGLGNHYRDWFDREFTNLLKADVTPFSPKTRGLERGSYIIEALETGRLFRSHFNVLNQGCITNLPDDCIVEVPGYVDRNGINIPRVGDLPLACAATCSASIHVQRMAVEAAVSGDVMLLKQAALHDPLTAAVCEPPEIWQMVDEMLVAEAKWLPQYKHAIAGAKKRLASEKPLGTRKWKGAAPFKAPRKSKK